MSERDVFKRAIREHADGREVCNCGEAYYDERGVCEYGCSTNQIRAKYELVAKLTRAADREDG